MFDILINYLSIYISIHLHAYLLGRADVELRKQMHTLASWPHSPSFAWHHNSMAGLFKFGALACSRSLYLFYKVRRARVIKHKNRGGFIDCQRKEVIFLSRARRCFRKERKEKWNNVCVQAIEHRFFVRDFSKFCMHLTETERNPSHVDVKYTVKTRD